MSDQAPVYSISIPVDLVKDNRISASAKLMYGVIDSFQKKSGVCFASNERLADELGGCTSRTASKCIGELKDAGYITIETDKTRKIFLKPYASDGHEGGSFLLPPEKISSTGVEENFLDPGRKFPHSNTVSIIKEKNKKESPKLSKPEPLTDAQLHEAVVQGIIRISEPNWSSAVKNELYRLIMELYNPDRVVQKAHPVRSKMSVDGTFRKLAEGKTPVVMINMLNDAIIGGWQGVQVPKKFNYEKPPVEERQYQCV